MRPSPGGRRAGALARAAAFLIALLVIPALPAAAASSPSAARPAAVGALATTSEPVTNVTLLVPCPLGCRIYAVWTIVVGRAITEGGVEREVSNGTATLPIPTKYISRTQFNITAGGIQPIQGEAITALALRYTGQKVGTAVTKPILTAKSAAVCLWRVANPSITIATGLQTFNNVDVLTGQKLRSYRWWALRTWPGQGWNQPAPVFRGAAGVENPYCGPTS